MTAAERKQLEFIIRSEIDKTTGKIDEIKEFTLPVEPDCAIDDISRTDAMNNKSIVDASLRGFQVRLNHLQNTLKEINNPAYGICTNCLKPIPFERLKIKPEIRLCANCLNKH